MNEELPTGLKIKGSHKSVGTTILLITSIGAVVMLSGLLIFGIHTDMGIIEISNMPKCVVGEVDERGWRTIGCSEFTIDMANIPDDGIVYSKDD